MILDIKQERQKRQEFKDILFALAESQTLLKDASTLDGFIERLEHLYCVPSETKKYRHFYSDIFSALTEIKQGTKQGDIETLGQNLELIKNQYEAGNTQGDDDISDEIRKLYDHVSLDIARMLYSDAGDHQLAQQENIQKIQNDVKNMQSSIELQKQLLQSAKGKLEASEKEYIAILSIFSAVVLAFIGGIAFSTSVLENVHQASIYRIILIVLLIGFVWVNTLYALFFCIQKLTSIRSRQSLVSFFAFNVIILVLIIATILAWNAGFVEQRDSRVLPEKIAFVTEQVE